MLYWKLAAFAACAALLTGCLEDLTGRGDRYEIKDVKGDVYLLNKATGQTLVREGGRLLELKRYDESELAKLSRAKVLTVRPIRGLEPTLTVKYRENALLFEFQIEGQVKTISQADLIDPDWKKYWEKDGNFLQLQFEDNDGFSVENRRFTLAGNYKTPATRLVDGTGKETEGYLYSGELPLSPEKYAAIVRGTLTWSLDKPADKK
ncbi:MAG: hypothetical protein ACK4NA_02105 [Alphaproteobacteria bacterium]